MQPAEAERLAKAIAEYLFTHTVMRGDPAAHENECIIIQSQNIRGEVIGGWNQQDMEECLTTFLATL
jgi:hypothetical protein